MNFRLDQPTPPVSREDRDAARQVQGPKLSHAEITVVRGPTSAAIYDLHTGHVYAANKTAADIITMLLHNKTRSEICAILANFQEISFEAAAGCLDEFFATLRTLGLITDEPYRTVVDPNDHKPSAPHTVDHLAFREVWCEITSGCNLRCVHCYASAGQNGQTLAKDLPKEFWINTVKQISLLGCQHLQITGGEPFFREDVWEIVDAALQCQNNIEIFSNLSLCRPRDIIERRGSISIGTTVFGHTSDVHDSITQIPGSFSRTVSAITELTQAHIPVRVAVILMEQNYQCFEDTVSFLTSIGVQRIGSDFVRSVGRGSKERLRPAASLVQLGDKPNSLRTTKRRAFDFNREYNSCWGQKMAVLPDGTVVPCIYARELKVGNLLEQSVSSIVSSNRLRRLWQLSLEEIETCSGCEFRYACNDCRPLALCEGKGLHARQPRCGYDPARGMRGIALSQGNRSPATGKTVAGR